MFSTLACYTLLFNNRGQNTDPAPADALLHAADAPTKPNIIFIYADDWGWGDLGCHGSTWLKTPNLDRLASQGTDFQQFNVLNPVCSPSRSAVMTGMYPARFSVHQHFASPQQNHERGMPDWLDPKAPSLPRFLKQAGYCTAHFGKWHLTSRETQGAPKPEAYGYDEFAVFTGGAGWESADWHASAKDTVAFIKANKDKPFFINAWIHESHTPHVPTSESMEKWKHLDPQKQVYAAVITDGDNAVGTILDALKAEGLEDNTIVLFSSDNGPEHTAPKDSPQKTDLDARVTGYGTFYSVGETGGMRGRKRSLFEGGVRVPFIVRWPGRTAAGNRNDTTVLTAVDLLPTLCAAAGVTLPADYQSDGENLLDAFNGKAISRTRPIFWQWLGTRTEPDYWPRLAVRDGDWKLVMTDDAKRAELHHLDHDRAEATDVSKDHPDIVARLTKLALDWKVTLPKKPNPECLSKQTIPAKPPGKPNIIFILTDDLGYSDLSCYGSPNIKTPCLDRMAAEGVRFTDFYAAASVCTPTRASLLTGCYPKRVGLHRGVLGTRSETGLHPDEVTIAELLRGQGYATVCIGKWHLGVGPETLPTSQGFDSYFGMPGANHGNGELYRDTKIIDQAGKIDINELTQRYTTEAVEFIKRSKDKPFFLYLPHSAPHSPIYASKDFRKKSAAGGRGDMIEEVDWSVGQVLQTLKDLNLDEKTLVIFTSDNGQDGIPRPPLHGQKSQCWEGGFRVPCIARWPGTIPTKTECREMTIMFDWLPTLAALAGAEPPAKRKIDGKDIWQTVCSKAKTPHDHFVYFSIAGSASAIRCGKWKLHVLSSGGGDGEDLLARRPDEAPPWLYDLEADIGETHNVAKEHPDVVKLLREKLQQTDKVLTQEARPVWDNPNKIIPKTGDGATAVPEALKGWKATQDLPADTVVTDYNEYVEKLPGVERFGVADVKYYVDDMGRNAVAVLVNVGETQWTHLIVYDKQNKRTGVTKFVAVK